ncbi:DUF4115 domain-containing protein [Vagococcus lutrae]|uniref:helix-turn-helix domain-containing protein n=1 Tax=Vagococcus lutrae TaxID=81947 RepID=UPI00200DAE4D|nr:RodZ domain-containing protein [Vagococcus lutrae]UQF71956.1 DUF4115 domain-containing protein [Vagococcus lutrae]
METIGERLKKARLEKGYTMDELQQLTKIQRQYLEALEENEFEKLPGSYYARNFIRQYAKTVDLNPDEMVTIYDGKTPKAPVLVDEVNHSRKALHQKKATKQTWFSRERLPMIILIAVATLIVGSILWLSLKDDGKRPVIERPEEVVIEGETSSVESETTQAETEESVSETVEEKQMAVKFERESGSNSYFTIKGVAEPRTLSFTSQNGRCWIGVMVDGNYIFDQTLEIGDQTETTLPKGANNVTIVLGASDYVSIAINDEDFQFDPNHTGNIKRDIHVTFKK